MVISDLHFGNKLERLDLVDRAYNYCIKQGINIVFCCGDMIDGSFGRGEKNIKDIYSQIEYFVKKYPFDKNIITIGVEGDHDISALNTAGQSLIEILKSYRHDVVIGGFNNASIYVKNDKINLHHHMEGGYTFTNAPISLKGHWHKYMTEISQKNILNVLVPSLSELNGSFPTALELTLTFKNGYINFANLKQVYFGDKDYIFSEMKYDLLKDRNVEIRPVDNEEPTKVEKLYHL